MSRRPWEKISTEDKDDPKLWWRALDVLYVEVDDHLRAGRFAEVDEILRDSDPRKLSLVLAIGVLSITFAAKHELNDRADYYRRVRARVLETDYDRADGLLRGLE